MFSDTKLNHDSAGSNACINGLYNTSLILINDRLYVTI